MEHYVVKLEIQTTRRDNKSSADCQINLRYGMLQVLYLSPEKPKFSARDSFI